ncbi:Uma2 family endonuclease [Chamaesiphon sp. VAR_48_metabat_403]|uniref:Uma2 family endonuclease n=1 Tax=Chamaesiphon sp. VAR_48_metabat_403 TaxID=2964700 RepID=UPI00286E98AC|nr:Uma2 family endonuclease [Chamaesiphon sp. VAR_48_metabat_403]
MVKTPFDRRLIPPLENGDRLTRYEFERRYDNMSQLKRAELIEGVVYMAAALRFKSHGQPHASLLTWLGNYTVATPGTALGDAPTVRLDMDNEPQPDAVLLIESQCGGRSRLSEDDYIEGAPELVVEIAASSVSIDLGDKKRAYRRNGIPEYIVWQVFDRQVDWFYLQEGEYISLPIDADGTIRSRVFPGLWLAVDDLIAGNMVRVLAVLQAGLAAAEHDAFVKQLSTVGD